MRNCTDIYNEWLTRVGYAELKNELLAMSESDVEDAFFADLSFGTGGLRGVMSAGTNRMNVYTVGKATRGLGEYLISDKKSGKRIAIGYDSRNNSERFARLTAAILAEMGFEIHIWGELLPTPMLSYAVRSLGCVAGVMITASHNPSKYNGYKVYREDGCQITELAAKKISEKIAAVDTFASLPELSFEEYLRLGRIKIIEKPVYEDFISAVISNSIVSYGTEADRKIKIVYTPLNGSGRRPVLDVLEARGFTEVYEVAEQSAPNGDFPTCPYPNPEIPEAMALGLKEMADVGADVLIATDPDCDRVGVGVKCDDGSYTLLTGNEIGMLLLEHICSVRTEKGTMPENPVFVKTVVTSDLAEKIAKSYGVGTVNVLTGFKYIGEHIGYLDSIGSAERFILGFEESCGYLTSGYVRDKDGVLAAMLVCELAAWHKACGRGLYTALESIYKKYGYCKNSLLSYSFEGPGGFALMQEKMLLLRKKIESIGSLAVESLSDYSSGIGGLPPADMLKFRLEGDSTVIIRPSGTEPKLKAYLSANGNTADEAMAILSKLKAHLDDFMQ